jgi:hypothetical protein
MSLLQINPNPIIMPTNTSVEVNTGQNILHICICGKCNLPFLESLEGMNIALWVLDNRDMYVPFNSELYLTNEEK